jgi:sulfur-carrier protein adenylyltransferase/sulfurtransferase
MPDVFEQVGSPPAFERARAAVADWLAQSGREANALTADGLARYSTRGFAAGWLIPVQFSDQLRRIELLLPIGFPWQPPRVALIDRPPFLTWPHVERDGLLCLAPNTVEIDPDDPVDTAKAMLGAASDAVEMFITGADDAAFKDEFATYWDYAADPGANVISILRCEPPTREVRLWRGKNYYLLAEIEAELVHWLRNRSGPLPSGFASDPAAFVWLGDALVPSEYPATAHELRVLAARADRESASLLSRLARHNPSKIVTVLGVESVNGPAIAAAVVTAPAAEEHGARDPLTKGFRPGAVPEGLLLARYFGGGKLVRRPIDRADAGWVHGRGQDERAARLRAMRVAVIGCGSIGAAVAIALAQAGVGHLILVDFDVLKWSNIGRHPLGAPFVGMYKANGLAQKLRADFPHIAAENFDIDVDTAVRRHGEALAACDLIVSATGSWAADSRLDAWHAAAERSMPILYAWTEAHALAGHAVLIQGEEASLKAGFNKTGVPHFRVTTWPAGASTRQEPACGAVYQPYGPVELGYINSLVGDLALDALLGEELGTAHRLWAGSGKRLRQLGGSWTEDWRTDASFREEGGVIAMRPWPMTAASMPAHEQAA